MKELQWLIAVVCLLLAAWLIIIAFILPAETEPAAPEVNAEGLCYPVKIEPIEIKAEATESEVTTYTEADVIALAQMLYGEARGCTVDNQAKCVWCVLNRVDDPRFPDTIIGVVSQSGQFYGYSPYFPVWDELRAVALDVLTRWSMEKQGADVARELPSTHLWFTGNGSENVFRGVY